MHPADDARTTAAVQQYLGELDADAKRFAKSVISARCLRAVNRLNTLCAKLLYRRYGSAAELAHDLHRFLNGRPILARPVGIVERFCRWAARNRTVAAALAGVAALLVLIAAGSLWAAAHFRKLEGEHRTLAQEIGELADQKGRLLVEKERDRVPKRSSQRNREGGAASQIRVTASGGSVESVPDRDESGRTGRIRPRVGWAAYENCVTHFGTRSYPTCAIGNGIT